MKKNLKKNAQHAKEQAGQVENSTMTLEGILTKQIAAYAIIPHTSRGVDLKILKPGSSYIPIEGICRGTIIHDGPGHYGFIARSLERKLLGLAPKSECLRLGQLVNVKQNCNGIAFPTFRYGRLYSCEITFRDFCIAAARELLEVADLTENHD